MKRAKKIALLHVPPLPYFHFIRHVEITKPSKEENKLDMFS
jgi:hypothetical protein